MTPEGGFKLRQGDSGMAWGVAGVAVLLAALSMTALLRPGSVEEPLPVLQAVVAPPEGARPNGPGLTFDSEVAVSPDGLHIVFLAAGKLWRRPLDRARPSPIAGTEGARYPFWSPDSQSIGFFAEGKLKTMPIEGGSARIVCDAPAGSGGAWAADGTILVAPDGQSAIFRVETGEGAVRAVTEVERPIHTTHRWPEVLPDGDHFLYLATSHVDPRGERNGIYLASMSGGAASFVTAADSKAVYSAGRLLFMRQGDLWAQPFDLAGRTLLNEPRRVAAGTRFRGDSWNGMFSASRGDVLAYEIGSRGGAHLTWIDSLGTPQGVFGDQGTFWNVRISPSGDQLAVAEGTSRPTIRVYDLLAGMDGRHLDFAGRSVRAPVWSPDGDKLALAVMSETGRLEMVLTPASEARVSGRPVETELDQLPTSWSPDGEWLVFDHGDVGASEIWAVRLDGSGDARPLVEDRPWARDGQVSPDGRWLLYTSGVSGFDRLYVTTFPIPGESHPISGVGAARAGRWSLQGDRVFFSTDQSMIMEVGVRRRKGGGLDVGMPRVLFSYRGDDSLFRGYGGFFDVGSEDRFLVSQGAARRPGHGQILLVLPWTRELR